MRRSRSSWLRQPTTLYSGLRQLQGMYRGGFAGRGDKRMVSEGPNERRGSSKNLSGIEASRGIAATLVILYHAAVHLNRALTAPRLMAALQFGHSGVDFFFVISGFVILFAHRRDLNNPRQLKRYVERRATRVLPTYWIALCISIFGIGLSGHPMPSIRQVFVSVSLLPLDQPLILDIAWTLRFELVFYCMFALLIVSRRMGVAVMALWFGAAALACFGVAKPNWLPDEFYNAFNLEFLFGMGAAVAVTKIIAWRVPAILLLLAVGVGLFTASAVFEDTYVLNGYGSLARLAYGLPAAMVVTGVARASQVGWLRIPTVLRALGSASYSMYLFQFFFIGAAWQVLIIANRWVEMPLAAKFAVLSLSAVVGGVLVSRTVEHPIIRFMRSRRVVLGSVPT